MWILAQAITCRNIVTLRTTDQVWVMSPGSQDQALSTLTPNSLTWANTLMSSTYKLLRGACSSWLCILHQACYSCPGICSDYLEGLGIWSSQQGHLRRQNCNLHTKSQLRTCQLLSHCHHTPIRGDPQVVGVCSSFHIGPKPLGNICTDLHLQATKQWLWYMLLQLLIMISSKRCHCVFYRDDIQVYTAYAP